MFVGRETSEQAQPIVSAVREVYPTVDQVMICNMADVRGIPKLVRKPVEMLMKSSYKDAVENLEAGRTAEDYVLDPAGLGLGGVRCIRCEGCQQGCGCRCDRPLGQIVGMYQGESPAEQVLAFLRVAGV